MEYQTFRINSDINCKKPIFDKSITKRLKDQAKKISTMLARKSILQYIVPSVDEKIRVTNNSPYNGRIKCKGKQQPLMINIIVNKGLSYPTICLSFTVERPDIFHCDKALRFTQTRMTMKFAEKIQNSLGFSKDYIYFGIESGNECILTLNCNFGKGNLL